MKYRKKPVVIDAFQFSQSVWDQKSTIPDSWPQWARIAWLDGDIGFVDALKNDICVTTPEGLMHISDGDYIIRGVKGEIYPCKPDIFVETYEKATG